MLWVVLSGNFERARSLDGENNIRTVTVRGEFCGLPLFSFTEKVSFYQYKIPGWYAGVS